MSKDTELSSELLELQNIIETAQRKKDQAQGGFEQVMTQIKNISKCKNLKELGVKIEELEKQ